MTVTGQVKWDEGTVSISSDGTGVLEYFLFSNDPLEDRGDAIAWMDANAPDELFGMPLDGLEINERITDNDTPGTDWAHIWSGVATYKTRKAGEQEPLEPPEEGDPQPVRLSIRSGSGGNLKMTSSRGMLDEVFAAPEWQWTAEPQIRTLLNLQADNDEESGTMFTPQGIDVPVGTTEIVVETIALNSQITAGYLVNATQIAGENGINDVVYRGFPVGCLKLVSFDSSQEATFGEPATEDNPAHWNISYTFQYQPPVPPNQMTMPPGLTAKQFTITKAGWWFMDVLYVAEEVTVGNMKFILPQAKRAAIHSIYPSYDFAAELGI